MTGGLPGRDREHSRAWPSPFRRNAGEADIGGKVRDFGCIEKTVGI
mgnify:FL=1